MSETPHSGRELRDENVGPSAGETMPGDPRRVAIVTGAALALDLYADLGLHADLARIGHLSGIGWRGDTHHRAHLGHPVGDRQDRCPPE